MIIKNGYCIDPASGREGPADILILDGRIAKIAPAGTIGPGIDGGSPESAANGGSGAFSKDEYGSVIDASGLVTAPGLIDAHVHFRDPGFLYKETLHTGALAAAKGGFTTVVCMANTSPVVDSVPVLADILRRAKEEKIRICQAASVTRGLKGAELTDMEALKEAGACGFTDDGIPILDAALLFSAMKNAAALGLPISLHEEDPAFITNNGINAGPAAEALGLGGSPAIAEESLAARDCVLALHSGADVVIQHISSGRSVALVRAAKAMGAKIHAEATPHHFTLTEDAVRKYGSCAKMNPPLRTEEDRMAIIAGLADGTIDLIATDHAPHSAEEKARPIEKAPSGIIGLETSLGLGITELVRPGYLTLTELMRKMSFNPAQLYHLPGGTLTPGAPADLVLFDPEEKWTAGPFVSKSSNSPFAGRTLYGAVHYTVCGGEIVYTGQ
ncbi:MAG: dihydroorotase [Lachnospiraceae bacterium]|nr:dihydroorotase [Lachnospiraceae bacterium]